MSDDLLKTLQDQFQTVRGRRVILDADVAQFYGVTKGHLNAQVSRSKTKFPEDFAFRLTAEEATGLTGEGTTTPSTHRRSGRTPRAFTPIGALVASSVLNTPKAIEISLQLVREIVAAAANPEFGRDILSDLADIEWRLAGNTGSPLDILRMFRQGRK